LTDEQRHAARWDESVEERLEALRSAALHRTPERLEALLDTLVPSGSVSLLIGEAGTGKGQLAREAASALAERLGERVTVIPLAAPSDPASAIGAPPGRDIIEGVETDDGSDERLGADLGEPQILSRRLIEAIEREAEDGPLILLAPGLDQYSPAATLLLDELVRSRRTRIVGTATRLSGAAAHISRDPRVKRIPVPPLDFDETRRFLKRLLNAEGIELHTLRRWHRVTAGNALSLSLLTLALERQGLIGRQRGVVYEMSGAETVPVEFGEFVRSSCSDDELRTLELIAHAEPVSENVFIQLLDPEQVATLRDRGLLSMGSGRSGRFMLSIRHQLLAAAVRQQMSPSRVVEVSNQLFDALRQEIGSDDPRQSPRLLFRLVAMGLDADRKVPLGWQWDTLQMQSGLDPRLRLRIALSVAAHPDASTAQLTSAALQAVQLARTIGNRQLLAEALQHTRTAVERTRRSLGPSPLLQAKLRIALAEHYAFDREDAVEADAIIAELERDLAGSEAKVSEAIRSAKVMLLAKSGRLREAVEAAPDPDVFDNMPVEWERTPARLATSLILSQSGDYDAAIRLADHVGSFAAMGEHPQLDNAMLLSFCGFVVTWAAGAVEAARHAYQELLRSTYGDVHYSGLVEACSVLISISDGQWRRAAQRAELLKARLAAHDRHGLAGLAEAMLGLALAALGEREASRRAIRLAERRQIGLSQVLVGYTRLMTLRARQWNADDDVAALSLQLASWARTERLDAVELQALHLYANEMGGDTGIYMARIRTLAGSVEPPMATVLLGHCEELVTGRSAWDSPSARRLTEFGIWMPLPQTDALSAREREIAMFAALGYSSRWIAEQFHLSVRTVDTHLRHVFTKLRVSGRDELRLWFRREIGTR
ncbi:MAG: helix-turn-helix transcriptional regulator, partial [Leucobacter sp.]